MGGTGWELGGNRGWETGIITEENKVYKTCKVRILLNNYVTLKHEI